MRTQQEPILIKNEKSSKTVPLKNSPNFLNEEQNYLPANAQENFDNEAASDNSGQSQNSDGSQEAEAIEVAGDQEQRDQPVAAELEEVEQD